ncbi:LPS assembly protein LptD [Candidatus Photodesmus blepharus]|uniref:LPS assembly protein LptD n=1 Tax=Candidatus Photodesmus blepharonis TaxID=1179155 RepID=UPI00054F8F55
MSRFLLTILTILTIPQIQAKLMLGDDNEQKIFSMEECLINESEPKNINELPINIEADSLESINGETVTYNGNVVIVQGKKRIQADSVTLHQKDNIVIAEGNVHVSDGELKTVSSKVTNHLNTNFMFIENTKYSFLCQPGRGEAVNISKTEKTIYQIEDGFITSCSLNSNAWRIRSSKININPNKKEVTFYNPRFEIRNLPIFYLPLLTIPIGDTRKTGFLYPTVSYSSSNGFKTEVPIYWNLAPNYDLKTIFKYMQERDFQINSKFRYLSSFGSGSIDSEFFPNDKKYLNKRKRWGFQYKHNGIFQETWKFKVDYSKVGDITYFTDIDSSVGNRKDGQLTQETEVTYRSDNWDVSILVRDFQTLTENSTPYRLIPQFQFHYYTPALMKYLDFDLISHISRFDTDDEKKPSSIRIHIEPGFTIPIANTWGVWTTEARLLGTFYQEKNNSLANSNSEENIIRIIPELSTHASITFERDNKIFSGYTQTLEPQVQYLYVPKKEQSNIVKYDTALLQTDYYNFFSKRKFSSVDEIAGANKFSYSASSRFFDVFHKERLNISFGQVFYLEQNSEKSHNPNQNSAISNYSAWAIETNFNYDDYFFYHGGIQYDVDTNEVQLGNSTLEYRFNSGYLQTNYRYVSQNYIEKNLSYSEKQLSEIAKSGISQLGLFGQYQINSKWRTNVQYFYDLTTSQELEWLASLGYQSNCWYIGLTYSNQFRGWEDKNNWLINYPNLTPIYENNFSINFGITGFGTNIGSDSGIIGIDNADNTLKYARPFLLNN